MNRLELLIKDWERTAKAFGADWTKYNDRFDLGYAAGIKSCISDLKTTMPFIKLKEDEDA